MKKLIITFLITFCSFTWAMANEDGREYIEGYAEGWKDAYTQLGVSKPQKDYYALKNIRRIQIRLISTTKDPAFAEKEGAIKKEIQKTMETLLKKKGFEILDQHDRVYTTKEASLVVFLCGETAADGTDTVKASIKLVQKGYFLREVEGAYKFYQGVATTWNSSQLEGFTKKPEKSLPQWVQGQMVKFFEEWDLANPEKKVA